MNLAAVIDQLVEQGQPAAFAIDDTPCEYECVIGLNLPYDKRQYGDGHGNVDGDGGGVSEYGFLCGDGESTGAKRQLAKRSECTLIDHGRSYAARSTD